MSPSPADRRSMARIRQLACLDATGPQMIEPVLHELHQLFGFDSLGYFYPDSTGALATYIEAPHVRAVSEDRYFTDLILASEREVLHRSSRDFADAVRHEHGPQMVHQLVKVPEREFERSEVFNLIFRPAEIADCVSLVLRGSRGEGVGALKFYRGPGSRPFRPEETALLAQIEPWLASALQCQNPDDADGEVQGSAMVVATPQGRLLWLSPQAEHLLYLACGPRLRRDAGELPAGVLPLLQRLQAAPHDERAAPPQALVRNAHGVFVLRVVRLDAAAGEGQAVGLRITHRVARPLRILHALRRWRLPDRQHEMAYWLARGLPEPQIAERMSISANTAVYHRRQIYARMGADNRHELLERLGLAPAAAR